MVYMVRADHIVRRFLGATAPRAKRMVLMVGPPAAGKGFFLGEPEKDENGELKSYKGPDGKEHKTRYGWKLPQMLVDDEGNPLLSEGNVPEAPDQDESDNHLRAIQFSESKKHFENLEKAHKEGPEAFKKAVSDMWYSTKDGNRVELGDHVSYDDFPDNHAKFYGKANKEFYVSMRGWHDDAKKKNAVTGKAKERFKDEARHRFDGAIGAKVTSDDKHQSDLFIVDSAGEDIDTQDWKGQIESAKANGYEVTVVFLHPEQADTELSNLSRGKVMGKRMVDQEDISNWYKQNESALKEIAAAAPDNFVHYRKAPPGDTPEESAKLREQAREMMNGLAGMSDEEKKAAKKEISKTLYGASYKLNKDTSYGKLANLPKKAAKDIAETVKKQNEEAEKSAPKAKVEEPKKSPKEKVEKAPNGVHREKAEDSQTRIKFLKNEGDKKVPNPNPESRKRFPQVKVRSLPWKYQKRFYDQWRKRSASVVRVAQRFSQERKPVMANEKDWLSGWMGRIAKELESQVTVDDYNFKAKALQGPVVHVIIEGAAGDTTTAKKVKPQVESVLKEAVQDEMKNYQGFSQKVTSQDRGEDLVIVGEIIFP